MQSTSQLHGPRSVLGTLGIIGGGQLAKMTAQAASLLGLEIVVLEKHSEFPAQALDTHALLGDWNDPAKLLELARLVDVLTLENEFVDASALAAVERAGHRVWPSSATMALVQDKFEQKRCFEGAGLPLVRYAAVESLAELLALGTRWGWPLVLKKRRNSYDGKGNATVSGPERAAQALLQLGLAPGALYAEEFCRLRTELALIAVRGQDGASAVYPLVETINADHICHVVRAPAGVDAGTSARASALAARAMAAVGGVGAFGLELFWREDGALLINEIAPRVHNTGHYTIEACDCSQFENHVRAVLGLPLGSTRMRAPAAAMVNLLGAGPGSGRPAGLERALAVPGAHVHIYGKQHSLRGRKMGHVTALGATPEEALARARAAADALRFGQAEGSTT